MYLDNDNMEYLSCMTELLLTRLLNFYNRSIFDQGTDFRVVGSCTHNVA